LASDMREIWLMQPRFEKRVGSGPFTLVEQARFRAGFDFMRLRAVAGEIPTELADWWEDFSLEDDGARADMLDLIKQSTPKVQRVSKHKTVVQNGTATSPDDGAPRKRRRRRRKPSADAPPHSEA